MYPEVKNPFQTTWATVQQFAKAAPNELQMELGPFIQDGPKKYKWLKVFNKHYWPQYVDEEGNLNTAKWEKDYLPNGTPKATARILNRPST